MQLLKMKSFYLFVLVCILPVVLSSSLRRKYVLNENWICNVKKSCLECLRLSQCSWCQAENRCFSRKLQNLEDFCRDNATEYRTFGLSFVENAMCSCAGGHLEEDSCYPPGVTEGPKCSGRGACQCGRCNCNPMPDTEHPNKMVLGEYCEYDNFSCDGPGCNEGPYLLHKKSNNDSSDITNATTIESKE